MRAVRFASIAALAWLVAIGFAVVPSAQAPMSEEDYDKAMKSVGATVGSMRKNMEAQAADAVAADARKMIELQKANVAFWTARKTQDATEWATAAMNHATAVEKAATAKDLVAAAEGMKMLMGTCAQCHGKYRDKGADGGYIIKKG
jgi:mono/diheme cytochrome c family protein